MFQRIVNFFKPRLSRMVQVLRLPLRAKYDAAQTTDDNRRHWANADGLSAAAANSLAVRHKLRTRARYEFANNTYCQGIVLTLSNDVIGRGPRLQITSAEREANTRVEKAFAQWSKAIGLAAKLRTMRVSRAVDGESFAVFTTNPLLNGEIKLDLKVIEADQVTDCTDMTGNDGITFDAAGNPQSYVIQKEHPGSLAISSLSNRPTPTPANAVIHWFRADRPGQIRGIPEITASLPLFAQLRRFTLATLAAAETAADFAAIAYTTANAAGEADELDPFMPIEIEQRSMLSLPAGWQMSQFKAEHPNSTYTEFKKEILNEIARCMNMPFNVAACNSSGYNYSSGRLDHQTYYKAIRVDQDFCEQVVMCRILSAWLEEAALVPGLLPLGQYSVWMNDVQYFWDGQEHVDPLKEAKAQEVRLFNHTTTLSREFARVGQDWETELRQRARELQLMAELGLNTMQPNPNQKVEEDEEESEEIEDADEEEIADA